MVDDTIVDESEIKDSYIEADEDSESDEIFTSIDDDDSFDEDSFEDDSFEEDSFEEDSFEEDELSDDLMIDDGFDDEE